MTQRKEGIERRKYIRIREEDVLVCEPFGASALEGVSGRRLRALTRDVSEGGVLFESSDYIAAGTILRMEISIKGWEKYKREFLKPDEVKTAKPLVVLGKVVRVEIIKSGSYEIGVAFMALDAGHKWALKQYLVNASKGLK